LAFLNLLNVTYLCMSLQVIVLQPIISTWSNNLITRAETAVHFAEMSIVTCTGWLYVLSHGETIECYSSNFDDHYPCNKAIDFISRCSLFRKEIPLLNCGRINRKPLQSLNLIAVNHADGSVTASLWNVWLIQVEHAVYIVLNI
jgi:hypothetical protein